MPIYRFAPLHVYTQISSYAKYMCYIHVYIYIHIYIYIYIYWMHALHELLVRWSSRLHVGKEQKKTQQHTYSNTCTATHALSAVYCSVLQCDAACCSVLQCAGEYCVRLMLCICTHAHMFVCVCTWTLCMSTNTQHTCLNTRTYWHPNGGCVIAVQYESNLSDTTSTNIISYKLKPSAMTHSQKAGLS